MYSHLITIMRTAAVCVVAVPLLGCTQFPSYSDLASFDPQQADAAPANTLPSGHAQNLNSVDELTQQLSAASELEAKGKSERAIRIYRRLSKEFPADARAFHRLGVLLDKTERSDESTPYYRSAIELLPSDTEILCDYGYSCYLRGELKDAETALRKAASLDAGMERAHNNLGLVLARQGNDEEAIKSFQRSGISRAAAEQNLKNARAASRLSARGPA